MFSGAISYECARGEQYVCVLSSNLQRPIGDAVMYYIVVDVFSWLVFVVRTRCFVLAVYEQLM